MARLIIEIQCGNIRGALGAPGAGAAFRKIVRKIPKAKRKFGALARFRVFDERRNLRSVWLYQEPGALLKDKMNWIWP